MTFPSVNLIQPSPPIQLLPTKQKWWRKEPNNHFMSKVDSLFIQNGVHRHWFHYRILRSGPLVTGCCNGEIQSFFPKSGPFPDHFFNFSGLLVVLSISIVKKVVKGVGNHSFGCDFWIRHGLFPIYNTVVWHFWWNVVSKSDSWWNHILVMNHLIVET